VHHSLKLHAGSRGLPITRIEVIVGREPHERLTLRYSAKGEIRALRIPDPAAPTRTDGLWQHTCFEAFLREASNNAYYEFNFSPSGAWAAYRFSGYRSGMEVATAVPAPRLHVRSTAYICELEAALQLDGISDLAGNEWRLGLSAVIEEAAGSKSYWALAFPPGKPDFHHRLCFACVLPAPHP
jgi:hypothetical protein